MVRTGFWQKVADTFFVLMGDPGDDKTPHQLGIFAYTSLFLLPLAYHFVYRVAPSIKNRVSPLTYNLAQFGAGALVAPILLPLGTLAVGVTLALALPLLMFNFITLAIRKYLEKVVKENLEVRAITRLHSGSTYTINQFLDHRNYRVDGDRGMDNWDVTVNNNRIKFSAPEDFNNALEFETLDYTQPMNATPLRIAYNQQGLHALFKLNLGGITEKLEKAGFNFKVF